MTTRSECTSKRAYLFKEAAERAMRFRLSQRPNTPLRVYKCTSCPCWHLTSRRLVTADI
jgi:hypothetical protein